MTRLQGEFETDLAPPDVLVACAEAIEGLGWRTESVNPGRIVAFADSGSADPAKIEVLLIPSDSGTELRIVGSDGAATGLGDETLIAELDRARGAIQASIEGQGEPGGRLSAGPLFRERARAVQVITALLVPAAFGAVVGIVLGISAAVYWALQIVALIGGVLAGLEHPSPGEGARRGLVGGTIYGAFLLIAHGLAGTDAEVKLPDFAPVLVVFTALFGVLAGALGGRLRRGLSG